MIVWINGTHGVGKTTTAALVAPLLPGSRVFDAETVGIMLRDVSPPLPETDNFQHWPAWREVTVATAASVHAWTDGPLVMPMTVLREAYWREIGTGLAGHGIEVCHVVLHADTPTLVDRIDRATPEPSAFRHAYVEPYAEAARTWLHREAEVVDTTDLSAAAVAERVAGIATR